MREQVGKIGNALFSSNFKEAPYWLETPGDTIDSPEALPRKTDVVVIGSGYTGLHTALQTARAGRATVVLEAGVPGEGCSTRNGGQISTSIKPSIEQLAKTVGLGQARAIRQEGESALQWIEHFVHKENIECDFQRNGRFHAAHTPKHYDLIAQQADVLAQQEGIEAYPVPRHQQYDELGTDIYYGGVVYPRHASLHASKYHNGLLRIAQSAGVDIFSHCAATLIKPLAARGDARFEIQTEKGNIITRDIMIATNGYTGSITPWHQERVIPIGSYVIATEPLPKALIEELFPTNRIASDTCRVVYYYRSSPDRTRVLFGGRVSANETNPTVSGPKLFKQMCRIFPQLQNTQITHSWAGTVAYTFDTLAHTGKMNGQYYAMGFCGSGVSMASYLGMRAGQKIIGDPQGQTALDDLPFPTRPFYRGKPWFLPAAVSWYRWLDKFECHRAAAQK